MHFVIELQNFNEIYHSRLCCEPVSKEIYVRALNIFGCEQVLIENNTFIKIRGNDFLEDAFRRDGILEA